MLVNRSIDWFTGVLANNHQQGYWLAWKPKSDLDIADDKCILQLSQAVHPYSDKKGETIPNKIVQFENKLWKLAQSQVFGFSVQLGAHSEIDSDPKSNMAAKLKMTSNETIISCNCYVCSGKEAY